nr:hypothetical protein Cduv_514 [Cedratvirus duvanny]
MVFRASFFSSSTGEIRRDEKTVGYVLVTNQPHPLKIFFGENSFRPFSKNSAYVKNPKGILSKKYFLDPGLVSEQKQLFSISSYFLCNRQ